MERCETCRHYVRANEDDDWPPREERGALLGSCSAITSWDASSWVTDDGGRRIRPGFADVRAFVRSDDGLNAPVLVRPDFGCVMHEAVA